MPRSPARFRLSITDNHTRILIKVELIPAPGIWSEQRSQIRGDGQEAEEVKVATFTEVFDRLQRWSGCAHGARRRDGGAR